jgi:hypothetical protein
VFTDWEFSSDQAPLSLTRGLDRGIIQLPFDPVVTQHLPEAGPKKSVLN